MNSHPGVCVTTKVADVTVVNPIAVNVGVCAPAPLIHRFVNVVRAASAREVSGTQPTLRQTSHLSTSAFPPPQSAY
jgi:hypothetical protein